MKERRKTNNAVFAVGIRAAFNFIHVRRESPTVVNHEARESHCVVIVAQGGRRFSKCAKTDGPHVEDQSPSWS
jgi:hypothetical protein